MGIPVTLALVALRFGFVAFVSTPAPGGAGSASKLYARGILIKTFGTLGASTAVEVLASHTRFAYLLTEKTVGIT